jgi:uncharacterized protein (DUF488 family)
MVDVSTPTQIWSVGHSKHVMGKFLSVLEDAAIACLVDVRSQPYSRYSPHFNEASLKTSLVESGICYEFMGDSLGGRPPETFMYDEEGHVLYGEMAKSERFRHGIEKLVHLGSRQRTVMMCSEESPVDCHRRLLIARVLAGSIEVIHLRADGSALSESDWMAEVTPPKPPTLFELEEVKQWRSIRPVSLNTVHDASSEH